MKHGGGSSIYGAASLQTVITCHQRKHEWSDVPGHIREEFKIIGQETESGKRCMFYQDSNPKHSQNNARLVSKNTAWPSQSSDLNLTENK